MFKQRKENKMDSILFFIKIFLVIWVIIGINAFLIKPYLNKKYKKIKDAIDEKHRESAEKMMDHFKIALENSIDETKKLRSNEIPTDEDILLYYKMYCKKFECDSRDTWTTLKPMSFDEWEEKVKDENGFTHGWRYMIGKTSDAFVGFSNNMMYQRYRDYKKMVEMDDEKFLHDLEGVADEVE